MSSILAEQEVQQTSAAAHVFDQIVHNGAVPDTVDEAESSWTTVAVPRTAAPIESLQPGDVVIERALGEGRVAAIRQALDAEGFSGTAILAYSAKSASGFYGPFREAADSAPKFGDRRGYQMDPANSTEALREIALDIEEGADIVMVKPALAYLDVIRAVREVTELPLAAYNVSGEYAMVKAAAANGWIDGDAVMAEILLGFKRAGADMILSYAAVEVAERIG
jgi:porphobilinogen synthase